MPNARVLAAAGGLPTRRATLATLAGLGATLSLSAGAAAAAHPDARLLALGAEHVRLQAEDRRLCEAIEGHDPVAHAAWEANGERLKAIHDIIAAEPAAILDGFVVKARALASIYSEDDGGFTSESLEGLDGDTSDWALVRSILLGLVAIGTRQEGGAA